jgi:nucleotide-binding universal stress UspA family protein
MFPIKTVLHATDFSPASDAALVLAGAVARDHRARLVLLHVGRPPLQAAGGAIHAAPAPEEWGKGELERQLRQREVSGLGPGPEYRLEYADDPGGAIVRVAGELGCDLIVLGTHGRTGLTRLLMGSVAERVVRQAACPVLTVKMPHAAKPAEQSAGRVVTVF